MDHKGSVLGGLLRVVAIILLILQSLYSGTYLCSTSKVQVLEAFHLAPHHHDHRHEADASELEDCQQGCQDQFVGYVVLAKTWQLPPWDPAFYSYASLQDVRAIPVPQPSVEAFGNAVPLARFHGELAVVVMHC